MYNLQTCKTLYFHQDHNCLILVDRTNQNKGVEGITNAYEVGYYLYLNCSYKSLCSYCYWYLLMLIFYILLYSYQACTHHIRWREGSFVINKCHQHNNTRLQDCNSTIPDIRNETRPSLSIYRRTISSCEMKIHRYCPIRRQANIMPIQKLMRKKRFEQFASLDTCAVQKRILYYYYIISYVIIYKYLILLGKLWICGNLLWQLSPNAVLTNYYLGPGNPVAFLPSICRSVVNVKRIVIPVRGNNTRCNRASLDVWSSEMLKRELDGSDTCTTLSRFWWVFCMQNRRYWHFWDFRVEVVHRVWLKCGFKSKIGTKTNFFICLNCYLMPNVCF